MVYCKARITWQSQLGSSARCVFIAELWSITKLCAECHTCTMPAADATERAVNTWSPVTIIVRSRALHNKVMTVSHQQHW